MELYIEYVILDNILLDWYILSMLKWTLGLKVRYKRIALFLLISIVFALLLPYVYSYIPRLLLLYKIATFAIMTIAIKKYKNVGEYLTYLLVAIIFSSMIAGLCYAIVSSIGIRTINNAIFIFNSELPMGIMIGIIYTLIGIIRKTIIYIYHNVKKQKYIYNVELVDNGKKINLVGYYDSGNCIKYCDAGVSIISFDAFQKLYSDVNIIDIIKGENTSKLKNAHYIEINTITGKNKYMLCVIDAMKINNKIIYNPKLAIAYKNFNNFDVILHKDILGGIE